MKSLKLVILAFTIALAQANSIEGCFSNKGKYCETCYKRKPLYPAQGCGPIKEFDRCAQYTVFEKAKKVVCTRCFPGFYLKITDTTRTCEQVTLQYHIDFCLNNIEFYGANLMCYFCSSQRYSVFNEPEGTYSCQPAQNVKHSDPNCMWGASTYNGFAQCYRCQEGYTWSLSTGTCKLEKELNVVGCLLYDTGKCLECNVYEGYSMQADGSCLKNQPVSKNSPRLFDN